MTTLGYHHRSGKFSYMEVSDGFRGPTNAHEPIDVGGGSYTITRQSSGKIIPVVIPVGTSSNIHLPTPSPGLVITLSFINQAVGGIEILPHGNVLGRIASVPTFPFAFFPLLIIVSGSSVAPGDTLVFKAISDTHWYLSGAFASDVSIALLP